MVNRITPKFTPDDFQFGFRPVDGVVRGFDTLDAVLTHSMKELRPLSIAVLDLEKAFDSVKHSFIIKCLNELELPPGVIEYLMYIYSNAKTTLSFKECVSEPIHPSQGFDRVTLCLPCCSS